MNIIITSAHCIHAGTVTQSVNDPDTPNPDRWKKASEPVYKERINPMQLRRMNRLMKMSLYTALDAVAQAGLTSPDAVIVGTGMGCLEYTESFLSCIDENQEQTLNPSYFITSTHNTPAAQIALYMKCRGYNSTYSHKAFSFEHALIDAALLLDEGRASNVLVSAADEITPGYIRILKRLGSAADYGEGAASFICLPGSVKTEKRICRIIGAGTASSPEKARSVLSAIFKNAGIHPARVSLVLSGAAESGGERSEHDALLHAVGISAPAEQYKKICGEYHTSSAFALHHAAGIIGLKNSAEVVLICNVYKKNNYSFILVSKY